MTFFGVKDDESVTSQPDSIWPSPGRFSDTLAKFGAFAVGVEIFFPLQTHIEQEMLGKTVVFWKLTWQAGKFPFQ